MKTGYSGIRIVALVLIKVLLKLNMKNGYPGIRIVALLIKVLLKLNMKTGIRVSEVSWLRVSGSKYTEQQKKRKLNLRCLIEYNLTMFWRWLFCLLEACVEKCKDCTRLYSLKDKCPKNILPEFRFDSLNGYHEWIFRRNVIELDLNKHLRFFCCSVYIRKHTGLKY